MKKLILFSLVVAIIAGLYSCQCGEACDFSYEFGLLFEGYTDNELTPVVIKSYKKGSGFTILTDSTVYPDVVDYMRIKGNDSSDYIISLPTAGLADSITQMIFDEDICRRCGKQYRVNMLAVYALNGKLIYTPYQTITIKK